MAFEIAWDAVWPSKRVNTRLVGLAALPVRTSGFFNCYPELACPANLLRAQQARVSAQMVLLDFVYSPVSPGATARPYALLGAGFKRYHYAWPNAITAIDAGTDIELTPALNAGLGIALEVLGASLRAEIADYWTPSSDHADRYRILASSSASRATNPLRRFAQHDLSASLGWQILRF
ncbi:MAG: hypothetical protein ACRENP_21435 [Longimicrobiales bacterium]